jgi:hypothetical protein
MSCNILVSNSSGVQGEIVAVTNGDHVFSKNESLDGWIDDGGNWDSWIEKFID